MRSRPRGSVTSAPEVTSVSAEGVWVLVDDRELFMPHDDFPWFKDARLREVLQVERGGRDHLRWPALDVDLSIESILEPARFPLVSKPERGRRRVPPAR